MFEALTEKFQNLVSSIAREKKLTEENISDAVRQVRLALLEADVSYTVASRFVKRVKERAVGEALIKSVTPSEQFIKIVHDELTELMGGEETELSLQDCPSIFMLCGLQGSGKTTHTAKLARFISKKYQKKKVLLAACDLQRPAAVEQLKRLAKDIDIEVFSIEGEKNPRKVAKKAREKAFREMVDVLIVDTAGRLHLDDALMDELQDLKKILNPDETLFVANAMTGQDAVKVAAEFDGRISITGSILTMLDGNARAGAAISIREITQKPLKFEGVGEKADDIQIFNPKSMADRILGMGDVINLVRKAEENLDEEESKKLEKKLKKATFNYDDYLKKMGMVKKMGSFKSLLKMVPGMSMAKDIDLPEEEFKKNEAIILSMTPNERIEKDELSYSRRKRIAIGSATAIDDVNRMVKGFKRMKKFFKQMPRKSGGLPQLKQMKQNMEKMPWR